MKTILLMLFASSILMWGCEEPVQDRTGKETPLAATTPEKEPEPQVLEEEAVPPTVQEYVLPKSKSEEELAALDALDAAAVNAEMAFFGSPRLAAWVDALDDGEDEDGMPLYGKLEQEQFDQLTAKEHLYYCLFHPETWDQMCAEVLFEAGRVKGIAQFVPYDMSGDDPSDRQIKAVEEREDSIKYYVKTYLDQSDKVSMSLLRKIVQSRWVAMVSRLITLYQNQSPKQDILLTAFIELMVKMDFKPWQESEMGKSLDNVFYGYLPLNEVNADKILYYTKEFLKKGQANE